MVLVPRDGDEHTLLDYEVLLLLDHTPSSVAALARATGHSPAAVEASLARAEERGLAVDWGDVWATTWRAKLKLEPHFFRVWVPASLAAGGALTVLALALNGPDLARPLLPWVAAVAVVGVAGTLWEVRRDKNV